jgi:hypothetical protein
VTLGVSRADPHRGGDTASRKRATAAEHSGSSGAGVQLLQQPIAAEGSGSFGGLDHLRDLDSTSAFRPIRPHR